MLKFNYLVFSSDGKQNSIPNVWQVVFANVSVEGRAIHSDIYDFFDGSGHILTLPCYDFEILHCCNVASNVLMFKIYDGAFKCSLYLSSKVLADSPIYSS